MHRTDFWTLWEKARVGWSERTASKHVYYQVWNRSPAQVGCMRQVLWAGALGWPRGMGWGGRWEGDPGWGTHVNPWLIHVNVWQKPLQYCKVISLQLIKINGKKNFKLKKKYIKKRKESTCQCREYGFNLWSRKILCALEQLNPCATSAEPCSRAHAPQQEKPLQCKAHAPQWRVAPAHCN